MVPRRCAAIPSPSTSVAVTQATGPTVWRRASSVRPLKPWRYRVSRGGHAPSATHWAPSLTSLSAIIALVRGCDGRFAFLIVAPGSDLGCACSGLGAVCRFPTDCLSNFYSYVLYSVPVQYMKLGLAPGHILVAMVEYCHFAVCPLPLATPCRRFGSWPPNSREPNVLCRLLPPSARSGRGRRSLPAFASPISNPACHHSRPLSRLACPFSARDLSSGNP